MSEKAKFIYPIAIRTANSLLAELAPFCERIEIAGSLRREKSVVSDIEILYVPKMESRPDGLFDTKPVSVGDEKINEMLTSGVFEKRPNVNGHFAWGEKNKLAAHVATGIPVDLFRTTNENWFVSLVIRTGSKETNLKLTTGANKIGRTLNAYGSGVTVIETGRIIQATSERNVFELCGVPYSEPHSR